jgi:uncharacterized protein
MKMNGCVIVGFSILFSFSEASSSAGFDCMRAQTPVEKSICSSQELSGLDEELNALYFIASQAPMIAVQTKNGQARWLRQRNECLEAPCLAKSYRDRIAELKIQISLVADLFPNHGNWVRDYGSGGSPYCQASGNTSSFSVSLGSGNSPRGNFMCVHDCGRKVEDGAILHIAINNNIATIEYEAGFSQTTKSTAFAAVIGKKLYWAGLREMSGSYCVTKEVLSAGTLR